jgi:hypothetical protein
LFLKGRGNRKKRELEGKKMSQEVKKNRVDVQEKKKIQTQGSIQQPTNAPNKIQFIASIIVLHVLAEGCNLPEVS